MRLEANDVGDSNAEQRGEEDRQHQQDKDQALKRRGALGEPGHVLGEFRLLLSALLNGFLQRGQIIFQVAQGAFLLGGVKGESTLIGLKPCDGLLQRLQVYLDRPLSEKVRCGRDHVAFEQWKHLADKRQDRFGDADGAFKLAWLVQWRDGLGQCRLRRRGTRRWFRRHDGRRMQRLHRFSIGCRFAFRRSRVLGWHAADQSFGLVIICEPDLRSSGFWRLRKLDFRDDFANLPGRQDGVGWIWSQGVNHASIAQVNYMGRRGIPPIRTRASRLVSLEQELTVNPVAARALRSLQRNILAGVITIGPLFVTWLIFSFLLGSLAQAGRPLVYVFTYIFPEDSLTQPWVQSVLAVLLTLVVLYVVGRLMSEVIGRQAFNLFESTLQRLPVVAKVYSSVRQLLDSMMVKKDSTQRVVLVDFPIAGQKSIGFLTRTLVDSTTGEELAAVLLPNAINPTSAFLQILPLRRVTPTDLNMEQAMSMLLTGGAVAPESLQFSQPQEAALPERS